MLDNYKPINVKQCLNLDSEKFIFFNRNYYPFKTKQEFIIMYLSKLIFKYGSIHYYKKVETVEELFYLLIKNVLYKRLPLPYSSRRDFLHYTLKDYKKKFVSRINQVLRTICNPNEDFLIINKESNEFFDLEIRSIELEDFNLIFKDYLINKSSIEEFLNKNNQIVKNEPQLIELKKKLRENEEKLLYCLELHTIKDFMKEVKEIYKNNKQLKKQITDLEES